MVNSPTAMPPGRAVRLWLVTAAVPEGHVSAEGCGWIGATAAGNTLAGWDQADGDGDGRGGGEGLGCAGGCWSVVAWICPPPSEGGGTESADTSVDNTKAARSAMLQAAKN